MKGGREGGRTGAKEVGRQMNEPWVKETRRSRVRCQVNDQAGPGPGQVAAAQTPTKPGTEEPELRVYILVGGGGVKHLLADNKVNSHRQVLPRRREGA